jgi:hydrogenase-1 operon protein HyaF
MRLPIGSTPQAQDAVRDAALPPDLDADDTMSLVDGILREVAIALRRLAQNGEETTIGLRGLPLAESDRNLLEERLGRGEVTAAIEVAGASDVWETRYAGVWWVSHRGGAGGIAAEEIVIARAPEILFSNNDDVRAAVARLDQELRAESRDDLNSIATSRAEFGEVADGQ